MNRFDVALIMLQKEAEARLHELLMGFSIMYIEARKEYGEGDEELLKDPALRIVIMLMMNMLFPDDGTDEEVVIKQCISDCALRSSGGGTMQ